MSQELINALSAILLGLIFIFVVPLIGVVVGAFSGWVVGSIFPGTVALIGSAISGGATVPAWQVGAVLGYVGGFFKSTLKASKA